MKQRSNRILTSVYLDKRDWETFKEVARQDDRSAGSLLRKLIRKAIAQHNEEGCPLRSRGGCNVA